MKLFSTRSKSSVPKKRFHEIDDSEKFSWNGHLFSVTVEYVFFFLCQHTTHSHIVHSFFFAMEEKEKRN